jgi:hypothetical protein
VPPLALGLLELLGCRLRRQHRDTGGARVRRRVALDDQQALRVLRRLRLCWLRCSSGERI